MALSNLNFRDIGGLPTITGGTLKLLVLFRSEGPRNLTDKHYEQLKSLGVRSVFDLRSAQERRKHPHRWQDPSLSSHHCEMPTDIRAEQLVTSDDLRNSFGPAAARTWMRQTYAKMPSVLMPFWPKITDSLLSSEAPSMINCSAGKDRTGVAVALLLQLLEVPRQAIDKDYLRSDIFRRNAIIEGSIESEVSQFFGFVPRASVINIIFGVSLEFLDCALSQVEGEWGSITNYFSAAGVAIDQQQKLKAVFKSG